MASIEQRVNVGVGVVVRNVDGDVLLGKRISDKHGKGEYSFPGGKPDPGEHPAYAAVRELYEETGLVAYGLTKLNDWTYDRYDDYGVHFVTLYFECWVDDEPINREPDKCEEWAWYDTGNLPSPLFSGVKDVLGA